MIRHDTPPAAERICPTDGQECPVSAGFSESGGGNRRESGSREGQRPGQPLGAQDRSEVVAGGGGRRAAARLLDAVLAALRAWHVSACRPGAPGVSLACQSAPEASVVHRSSGSARKGR